MSGPSLYALAGYAGMVTILAAFFLLQTGRLRSEGVSYQLMNFLGAGGVLVSLMESFNMPVALLEGAWMAISLYGIVRALRARGGTGRPAA